MSGTDKSEGRQPAHPSALSPVLDGCVQKLIHKIHQLGEHSWCRWEVSGINHNSGELLSLSFRSWLGCLKKKNKNLESLYNCCKICQVVLGCYGLSWQMGMGNQVDMRLLRCGCHLRVPNWPDPWLLGHIFVGWAHEVAILVLHVGSSMSIFSVTFTHYCTPTTVERLQIMLTLWVEKLTLVEFSSVSHGHKSNQGLQLQVWYPGRPCCPLAFVCFEM